MNNIYKTPEADLVDVSTDNSHIGLYKISGIGIATFFGSLIAGGYLAAHNLKALGRPREARNVLITTVVATLGIIILSYLLPTHMNLPGLVTGIVQTMIMVQFSKKWFAYDLAAHIAHDGRMISNWKAFGIAMLFLMCMLAILVLAAYLVASYQPG